MRKSKKVKKNWSEEDTKILLWTFSHYALKAGLRSVEGAVPIYLLRLSVTGKMSPPLFLVPILMIACLRSSASRRWSWLSGGGLCLRKIYFLILLRKYIFKTEWRKRRTGGSSPRNCTKPITKRTKYFEMRSNAKSTGSVIWTQKSKRGHGKKKKIKTLYSMYSWMGEWRSGLK